MTFEQIQDLAHSHGYEITLKSERYDGEPRSDFSEGSDDIESGSARWRAEQRLNRQYQSDTQDLY